MERERERERDASQKGDLCLALLTFNLTNYYFKANLFFNWDIKKAR